MKLINKCLCYSSMVVPMEGLVIDAGIVFIHESVWKLASGTRYKRWKSRSRILPWLEACGLSPWTQRCALNWRDLRKVLVCKGGRLKLVSSQQREISSTTTQQAVEAMWLKDSSLKFHILTNSKRCQYVFIALDYLALANASSPNPERLSRTNMKKRVPFIPISYCHCAFVRFSAFPEWHSCGMLSSSSDWWLDCLSLLHDSWIIAS